VLVFRVQPVVDQLAVPLISAVSASQAFSSPAQPP
jgi:hypothetical protein